LPPGRYAVWFSGQLLGVNRRRRLVVPRRQRQETPGWTVAPLAALAVRPDWSAGGARLQLVVVDRQRWWAEHLAAAPAADFVEGLLSVRVPARLPGHPLPVELSLSAGPGAPPATAPVTVTGMLQPGPDAGTGQLAVPLQELPAGRWLVFVAGASAPLGGLAVRSPGSAAGDGPRPRLGRQLRRFLRRGR
jgi:hypothetical protein